MYHTQHYADSEVCVYFQPIDLCRELSFSLGNAVKYILRAPFKGSPIQDFSKAIDYLKDYLAIHTINGGQSFTENFVLALEAFADDNGFIKTLFNNPNQFKERVKNCSFSYKKPYSELESNNHLQDRVIYSSTNNRIYVSKESIQKTIELLEKKIAEIAGTKEELGLGENDKDQDE